MPARKRAKKAAAALPSDLNTALRAKRALELAIQGYDYATIADLCGWSSRSGAWMAVRRELARSLKPAAEELRQIEAARLENLWRVAYAQAVEKGSLWAIDRCVAISQQRRKMLGLDLPTPVVDDNQQRMYIIGLPDGHPADAPLPPLALPAGVPQPGPNDYVRAVPQSALDAV